MAMTIDNHIEVLKSYHNGFTGWASNIQDSIDVAVDIMRKYQKIQEIINIWSNDTDKDNLSGEYYLRDIREVLKDGNDR